MSPIGLENIYRILTLLNGHFKINKEDPAYEGLCNSRWFG